MMKESVLAYWNKASLHDDIVVPENETTEDEDVDSDRGVASNPSYVSHVSMLSRLIHIDDNCNLHAKQRKRAGQMAKYNLQ